MWQDMGLYWAWRGGPEGYCEPPVKQIIYGLVDDVYQAVGVINA